MKKNFILFIMTLAALALGIHASADVKTYPYPVIELEDHSLTVIKSDLVEEVAEKEAAAEALEMESSDEQNAENWDNTLREIKKRRGLKKIAHKLEELGEKGAESLEKMFSSLEQISIDFTLKQSVKILDGLKLKVEYEYEAEPSFYGNFFTRVDGYAISIENNLLELLGLDTKLFVGVVPKVRVKFYQFFDSLTEARKPNNGYLPSKIPLSADAALTKLKPGDLVAFDGEINLAYGAQNLWEKLKSWIKLHLKIGGVVSGKFRAFVFRGDNKIVRLRISALRNTPKIVSAKLSVFDLFDLGWSKLTEAVEKALGLDDLIKFSTEKVDRDLWLADYTLNMKDPRARSAYDAVFKRTQRYLAVAGLSNPFTSERKLRNRLFDLVEPLTELAVGDQNKANPAATVNFMGSNYSNGGQFEVEGGVRGIMRAATLVSKKDNRLKQRLYDDDGEAFEKFYFFPSWIKRHESSGVGTLKKEYKHQAANIIYETDENFNITKFQSIGFYREQTDKTYSFKEHLALLEGFQRILPFDMYEGFVEYLASKNWGQFSGSRQNVRISARYFINEQGLKRAEGISRQAITPFIVQAIQEMDDETGYVVDTRPVTGTRIRRCNPKKLAALGAKVYKKHYIGEKMYKYCKSITGLAKKLEASMDRGISAEKRNKIFTKLSKNSLFRQVGPGVLFDMMGDQNIDDVTFFEIVINSAGQGQPVRFTRGKVKNRPLYEIILQMERILNEDQPDMRLPGNQESIVRRIYDNT